jgi:hypothetical protein
MDQMETRSQNGTALYGIRGAATVRRWLLQYGKQELLKKVVKVEKHGEMSELKRLRDRVRLLERSLADAHMDGALDRAFLEILSERTGTDLASFKKKHAETLSGGRAMPSARSLA